LLQPALVIARDVGDVVHRRRHIEPRQQTARRQTQRYRRIDVEPAACPEPQLTASIRIRAVLCSDVAGSTLRQHSARSPHRWQRADCCNRAAVPTLRTLHGSTVALHGVAAELLAHDGQQPVGE
jgi:hypothetical protein